jgi:hypothetical protein
MVNLRIVGAAPAAFLVLLAVCEHASAPGPALAPSLAARTSAAAAAVGAPPADVQRASVVLAARMAGWDRPQAYGPAPERARRGGDRRRGARGHGHAGEPSGRGAGAGPGALYDAAG